MSNEYHQLAYSERCRIQVLLSSGKSQREVAKLLNRDPGTISREVAGTGVGAGIGTGRPSGRPPAAGKSRAFPAR